jgi:hypothetical protein
VTSTAFPMQSQTALGHSWSVASGTRWMSLSCEFGSCGSGFASGDGCTGTQCNDNLSGVINVGVGFSAVWNGIKGVAKIGGCAVVGAGKGMQSSIWKRPPTIANGSPSPSSVLRAVNGAYKIGAPGLMVGLSEAGPLGRLAGDAIPVVGEGLLWLQAGIAVHDGSQVFLDCSSNVLK